MCIISVWGTRQQPFTQGRLVRFSQTEAATNREGWRKIINSNKTLVPLLKICSALFRTSSSSGAVLVIVLFEIVRLQRAE